MGNEQSLPIHFFPFPDEAISSWETRLAEANCLKINDLYGLPRAAGKKLKSPEDLIGNRDFSFIKKERWGLGENGISPHKASLLNQNWVKPSLGKKCSLCHLEMDIQYQKVDWQLVWHNHCPIHALSIRVASLKKVTEGLDTLPHI